MQEEEQSILVSSDLNMNRVVHPADLEVIRAAKTGEGAIELTPEIFIELASAAADAFQYFQKKAKRLMTPERAEFVRELRVDQGHSWRMVAQDCYDAWDGDWNPPSNQIMGMALCEAVAERFDQDYMAEPWN